MYSEKRVADHRLNLPGPTVRNYVATALHKGGVRVSPENMSGVCVVNYHDEQQ